MAIWAAVLALTGFHYSGVNNAIAFTANEGTYFWSTGYAWGTVEIKNSGTAKTAILHVSFGQLVLKTCTLNNYGKSETRKPVTISSGNSLEFKIQQGR